MSVNVLFSISVIWLWSHITYASSPGSSLQDLMLRHGWRTGAIVPELELETRVVNTEQYAQSLTWLQALTGLLERMQVSGATENRDVILQRSRDTCH